MIKRRAITAALVTTVVGLAVLLGTLSASAVGPKYGWKRTFPPQNQLFAKIGVNGASSACVDQSGTVWVLDGVSARVSRYAADGTRLAVWGRSGTSAGDLSAPEALAVGSDGLIYIADTGNNRVQVFEPDGAFVRQFGSFGSGSGQLNGPAGVAVDSAGNVYVTEAYGDRVQVFDPTGASTAIWTFAGMGNPHGIAISNEGGTEYVFIADSFGNRVIKTDVAGGVVNASIGLSAGPGGTTVSRFGFLAGIRVDGSGNLWITDRGKHRVEKCNLDGGVVATYGTLQTGGSGQFEFDTPTDAMADASGTLYVADSRNARISRIDSGGAWLDPWTSASAPGAPRGATFDASGGLWLADADAGLVRHYSSVGATLSSVGASVLTSPTGVALAPGGGLYVSDSVQSKVLVFDSSGVLSATVGAPGSADGELSSPGGVAVAADGTLYVADTGNGRVQAFDPSGAWIRSYGTSGTPGFGVLTAPRGVAVDASGTVYVADTGNHRVQAFDTAGAYLTSWGGLSLSGTPGQFSQPSGIAVSQGGRVFVTDFGNNRIQCFEGLSAVPSAILGSFGAAEGQLAGPWGIAVSSSGLVAAGETTNHRVTVFAPDNAPPTTNDTLQPPGWSNSTVRVTLSANDDVGVAASYYKIGSGPSIRYVVPFYITTEGVTTITYWSVDRAGNTGPTGTTYAMIDKTAPVMTSLDSPTHPQLVTMTFGAPVLNWNGSDDNLVAGYSYSVDTSAGGSPDAVIDTLDTTVRLTDLPGGVWYFHIRARDDAGNWSQTATYRIAFTTPVRVGTPAFARTGIRSFRVSGVVYPAHKSGIYIYAEQYRNGAWTRMRTYSAATTQIPGGSSRYTASFSLPPGTWRFRAFHPFDGQHPGTASLASPTVVVP